MRERTAALLLTICAWAAPVAAQVPAVPIYAEGRMLVMVPPEHPKEALERI